MITINPLHGFRRGSGRAGLVERDGALLAPIAGLRYVSHGL